MKVKITKTFEVREPVAKVWDFLTDPRKVATCVPGAQITEAVDERRYIGTINVKVGPVVTNDKGELVIERMDAQNFEIELVGSHRKLFDLQSSTSVSRPTSFRMPQFSSGAEDSDGGVTGSSSFRLYLGSRYGVKSGLSQTMSADQLSVASSWM